MRSANRRCSFRDLLVVRRVASKQFSLPPFEDFWIVFLTPRDVLGNDKFAAGSHITVFPFT